MKLKYILFILLLLSPLAAKGVEVSINELQALFGSSGINLGATVCYEYQGCTGTSTYVTGDIIYSNAANQLESLNFLYEENGWLAVMPETLIPLISQDDNIYSVPVNIHRANVLWTNPEILAASGVAVPTTLDEWFTAMDTLQADGVLPLALGEQWTVLHLFETVLLASLGPDAYNGLWDGSTDWGSAEVTQALNDFAKVLEYVNADSASLSWQDAAQLVVDGDAAFNVMGDWAEGFFRELGKTPETDYGWAPVPGTGLKALQCAN